MTPQRCLGLLCLLGIAFLTSETALQAQKSVGIFTDAKEAGPDFKIQGEYAGEVASKGKFGAQVVALGASKFDVYFLAGGLPGAGWDTKTRIKISAATESEKTTLSGSGWSGAIADGKLTGKTADGNEFTLKYVVRKSPTLEAKPPQGAAVLFDGSNADAWEGGKLEGGLLNCGTKSKKPFGMGKLHIEFRTPFKPAARGQGRGNSGVYVHGKEIQVLDSFGLNGEKNECGAFYGDAKPAVNMCLPPLSWQTFDVEVKPAEGGMLHLTVWHNGIKVHENFAVKGTATSAATISLQNHGNPVVYRNIWIAPLEPAKEKP